MKEKVYATHSAHLDLFWMDTIEQCMANGAKIIDNAIQDLLTNPTKYFAVESVRFLEYYLYQNPDRLEENHHDGESLIRNVVTFQPSD